MSSAAAGPIIGADVSLSPLAESQRSATLVLALGTRDPRRARKLAAQINAVSDLYLFPALMDQPRLTQSQLQAIFRKVFDQHLDKLEAVAAREKQEAGYDVADAKRSDRVTGWVYRLLEWRGPRMVAIDAEAAAAMRADRLSDAEIAEAEAMLDFMSRQNDPVSRIEKVIREIGAATTPINVALARQRIYGAIAEANFEASRRHDRPQSGSADLVEAVLADRARVWAEPPGGINDSGLAPSAVTGDATPLAVSSSQPLEACAGHSANDDPVAPSIPAPQSHVEAVATARAADAAVIRAGASTNQTAPIVETRTNAGPAPKTSRSPPQTPALDERPVIVFGERLIEKNGARDWDVKTQLQPGRSSASSLACCTSKGFLKSERFARRALAFLMICWALSP